MAVQRALAIIAGLLRQIPTLDTLLVGAGAVYSQEYNAGNVSSSTTINFNTNGSNQRVRLTGDATLALVGPPGIGHVQIMIQQDGTGGRTLTFINLDSDVWISSGTQPTHNMAPDGWSIFNAFYDGSRFSAASLLPVGAA